MTSHKALSLTITVTSLAILVARSIWPTFFNIDTIGLGLIVLAVLPWLAPLIKSIDLPGVGKIELQEVNKKADDAKGAAGSAFLKAEYAMISAASSSQKTLINAAPVAVQLTSLMEEYNTIRNNQPPGPSRTSSMTSVVSKMISLTEHIKDFNVQEALSDVDNAGRRLAAYCWLYSKPNPDLFSNLVYCLTKLEDKSFGQYWAIQALVRIGAVIKERSISTEDARSIISFYNELPPESDRHYELDRFISSNQLSLGAIRRLESDAKKRISLGRWERASYWKKSK